MPVVTVAHPPIRVRSAPALDPPFDDEITAVTWAGPGLGQLALELPADGESDAPTTAAVTPGSAHGLPTPDPAAGAATGRAGGSAAAWTAAQRFLSTCLEIINGFRPAGHVRPLSDPADAARVIEQIQLARDRVTKLCSSGTPGSRPVTAGRRRLARAVLRRTRLCEPRPGVAEVVAVLDAGDRALAVAFRLERQRGRWVCTAAGAV